MNLDNLPYILIGYLILTIILEGLLSFVLGLRKKDLIYVVLVNMCTNPVLNAICILIYITYFKTGYFIAFIILEIIVFIGEGLIFQKVLDYKKINRMLLSVYLNLFSVIFGIVINTIN